MGNVHDLPAAQPGRAGVSGSPREGGFAHSELPKQAGERRSYGPHSEQGHSAQRHRPPPPHSSRGDRRPSTASG
eukprot:3281483-Prymnesium_polylepis.2